MVFGPAVGAIAAGGAAGVGAVVVVAEHFAEGAGGRYFQQPPGPLAPPAQPAGLRHPVLPEPHGPVPA